MRDARFTIPTSNLLTKVVDLLDDIPLDERDNKGDLYEYMLSKIATAGQNGQFRTPRHIIQLMVAMMARGPQDEICDPACGTAGFLVETAAYVSRTHADALLGDKQRKHFNQSMFHGFDFDNTMLRIARVNMLMHEVEQPDIRYCDSLAQSAAGDPARRHARRQQESLEANVRTYLRSHEDQLVVQKLRRNRQITDTDPAPWKSSSPNPDSAARSRSTSSHTNIAAWGCSCAL
jgi:type I restriction-modification system DNA methylase subunit